MNSAKLEYERPRLIAFKAGIGEGAAPCNDGSTVLSDSKCMNGGQAGNTCATGDLPTGCGTGTFI